MFKVRNMKCLEIPSFQTTRHEENTFRCAGPKLWNMLETKYNDVTELKSFKESIFGQHEEVYVPIDYNVLYKI